MQTQDARNIQLSVLFSPIEGVHWNEMSGLGKLIDDYQNGVKLAAGERQSHNKFILMSSYFHAVILRGCRNPTGLI
jgi:hypothetical protein